MSLSLGGCGLGGSDADTELEVRKARGTGTLYSGSCQDACGGKSLDGDCWCDDQCEQYGDCCSDVDAVCTPDVEPAATCEGACGGQASAGNCWCDDQCAQYGDCCEDKVAHCDDVTTPECPAADAICDAICADENINVPDGCPMPGCSCPAPQCGGIAGLTCPEGMTCQDDPTDSCDPNNGGADCMGTCVDCPQVMCEMYCPYGFATGDNGCPTCSCNPPPECPDVCDAVCSGEPEPPLPAGCPTPMCVCDEPSGCYSNSDCESGEVCSTSQGECETPPYCNEPGTVCPAVCYGTCVPDCPDPEAADVHYIADSDEDPSVCAVINFTCDEGQTLFSNSCGCGCIGEPAPAPNSCEGQCGGAAADESCWCDELCAQYGDCCSDADVWCADRTPTSGVCMLSSMDSCTTDADCATGGCGGELCYAPAAGEQVTTCQCTAPTGVSCGCVDGQCAWY